jgi:hypothetical protein
MLVPLPMLPSQGRCCHHCADVVACLAGINTFVSAAPLPTLPSQGRCCHHCAGIVACLAGINTFVYASSPTLRWLRCRHHAVITPLSLSTLRWRYCRRRASRCHGGIIAGIALTLKRWHQTPSHGRHRQWCMGAIAVILLRVASLPSLHWRCHHCVCINTVAGRHHQRRTGVVAVIAPIKDRSDPAPRVGPVVVCSAMLSKACLVI